MISISVVSHNQLSLILNLFNDIQKYCASEKLEVILTLNTKEKILFNINIFSFKIITIINKHPLGFGSNHNNAFKISTGEYFCVINPDISLITNPFPVLIELMINNKAELIAPSSITKMGVIDNNFRRFPSFFSIILRKVTKHKADYFYDSTTDPFFVDWVGGMFMIFDSVMYAKIRGFDEGFYLYFEDVDICKRMSIMGMRVLGAPSIQVIHDSRRDSHRNLRFTYMHIISMFRYFLKW